MKECEGTAEKSEDFDRDGVSESVKRRERGNDVRVKTFGATERG